MLWASLVLIWVLCPKHYCNLSVHSREFSGDHAQDSVESCNFCLKKPFLSMLSSSFSSQTKFVYIKTATLLKYTLRVFSQHQAHERHIASHHKSSVLRFLSLVPMYFFAFRTFLFFHTHNKVFSHTQTSCEILSLNHHYQLQILHERFLNTAQITDWIFKKSTISEICKSKSSLSRSKILLCILIPSFSSHYSSKLELSPLSTAGVSVAPGPAGVGVELEPAVAHLRCEIRIFFRLK